MSLLAITGPLSMLALIVAVIAASCSPFLPNTPAIRRSGIAGGVVIALVWSCHLIAAIATA